LLVADSASWGYLQDLLPGAGVATTTTLLSALWPADHIVFDWRVHAAANALRIHGGLDPTPGVMAQSSIGATETLDDYALVRVWILSEAERLRERAADVERALYRLSQDVKDEPGRTWAQYAGAVARQLDSVRARNP
jgi:hypothetical protein